MPQKKQKKGRKPDKLRLQIIRVVVYLSKILDIPESQNPRIPGQSNPSIDRLPKSPWLIINVMSDLTFPSSQLLLTWLSGNLIGLRIVSQLQLSFYEPLSIRHSLLSLLFRYQKWSDQLPLTSLNWTLGKYVRLEYRIVFEPL